MWHNRRRLFFRHNVKRGWQYVLRCVFYVVCVAWVAMPAAAQCAAQHWPPDSGYTVQPGNTLPALAARFGVDSATLVALNDLSDPRAIYPGQVLTLPPAAQAVARVPYRVALGDQLSVLARRAGVTWDALAAYNRRLNPANLVIGQALSVPSLASASVDESAEAPIAVALRYHLSYWSLRHLNPLPRYAGDIFLLPGVLPASTALPYPITALHLSPQPVTRGTTAMLSVRTAVSTTCEVAYFDSVEACYARDAMSWLALIGLSPLAEPGVHPLTLTLHTVTHTLVLPLPLHVAPGRYDFERIDLPPGRQSLLDPQLSQIERAKIAELRTLRSPERRWAYPFTRPVDASVTSYYGSRRSYGWGFNSFHGGTDFRGEVGTPVLAPAAGTVVLAETLVVRGNAILIDHGWGVVSGYWHLSHIDVTVGQTVTQGMRIGALGNTGLSTGPHLHWELWVNGGAVSALQWLQPDPFVALAEF